LAEDFANNNCLFNRGDDLQSAAAVGAVFDVDVEDPFEEPDDQGKYLRHALGFLAPLALGRDLFPYRGFYNGTSKQVNVGRLFLGESERLTL